MTTKGTLIGFGQRAQVGKDTAACALDLDRHHFADAIRDLAWHLNPYLPEAYDTIGELVRKYGWESAKTQFPSVRLYLQDLGAGARTTSEMTCGSPGYSPRSTRNVAGAGRWGSPTSGTRAKQKRSGPPAGYSSALTGTMSNA